MESEKADQEIKNTTGENCDKNVGCLSSVSEFRVAGGRLSANTEISGGKSNNVFKEDGLKVDLLNAHKKLVNRYASSSLNNHCANSRSLSVDSERTTNINHVETSKKYSKDFVNVDSFIKSCLSNVDLESKDKLSSSDDLFESSSIIYDGSRVKNDSEDLFDEEDVVGKEEEGDEEEKEGDDEVDETEEETVDKTEKGIDGLYIMIDSDDDCEIIGDFDDDEGIRKALPIPLFIKEEPKADDRFYEMLTEPKSNEKEDPSPESSEEDKTVELIQESSRNEVKKTCSYENERPVPEEDRTTEVRLQYVNNDEEKIIAYTKSTKNIVNNEESFIKSLNLNAHEWSVRTEKSNKNKECNFKDDLTNQLSEHLLSNHNTDNKREEEDAFRSVLNKTEIHLDTFDLKRKLDTEMTGLLDEEMIQEHCKRRKLLENQTEDVNDEIKNWVNENDLELECLINEAEEMITDSVKKKKGNVHESVDFNLSLKNIEHKGLEGDEKNVWQNEKDKLEQDKDFLNKEDLLVKTCDLLEQQKITTDGSDCVEKRHDVGDIEGISNQCVALKLVKRKKYGGLKRIGQNDKKLEKTKHFINEGNLLLKVRYTFDLLEKQKIDCANDELIEMDSVKKKGEKISVFTDHVVATSNQNKVNSNIRDLQNKVDTKLGNEFCLNEANQSTSDTSQKQKEVINCSEDVTEKLTTDSVHNSVSIDHSEATSSQNVTEIRLGDEEDGECLVSSSGIIETDYTAYESENEFKDSSVGDDEIIWENSENLVKEEVAFESSSSDSDEGIEVIDDTKDSEVVQQIFEKCSKINDLNPGNVLDYLTEDEIRALGGEIIENDATGFQRGLEVEEIIGATKICGKILFLVKWKDSNEADLVDSKEANLHCPQVVIKFYQDHVLFDKHKNLNENKAEENNKEESMDGNEEQSRDYAVASTSYS